MYCWGSIGHYDVTTEDGLKGINTLLEDYNNQGAQDAVIGLFMSPKLCTLALGGKEIKPKITSMQISDNVFEGYKPKIKSYTLILGYFVWLTITKAIHIYTDMNTAITAISLLSSTAMVQLQLYRKF